MGVRCPLKTAKRGLPCSYTLRGLTGLQELQHFGAHLRRAHPDEGRGPLVLREIAEGLEDNEREGYEHGRYGRGVYKPYPSASEEGEAWDRGWWRGAEDRKLDT